MVVVVRRTCGVGRWVSGELGGAREGEVVVVVVVVVVWREKEAVLIKEKHREKVRSGKAGKH